MLIPMVGDKFKAWQIHDAEMKKGFCEDDNRDGYEAE